MTTGLSVRKPEEIREVMADPTADAPADIYYMIRRPGMNITIIPEYRLGKEYPKTYGHFHKPEAEETYQILLGEAAMLVQKGVDPVKEVKMIRLKRGDSVTVPKGYAHCLINLGKGPVATLDDHGLVKFENDYRLIREKRGFAYYLVEDDEGRSRAILNPHYKDVPALKHE